MNQFLAELYGTNDLIKNASADMEKTAEEDFLGRVMAHAFVNELAGIEKEAGWMGALKGAVPGAALGAVPGAALGALAGGEGNRMSGALKGGLIGAGVGGAGGAYAGHHIQKVAPQILKDLGKSNALLQAEREAAVGGIGPLNQIAQKGYDVESGVNRGAERFVNYFK